MADTLDLFIAQQCLIREWATKSQLRECMKLAKSSQGHRLEDMLVYKKYLTSQQIAEIHSLWQKEHPNTTITCPKCQEKNER